MPASLQASIFETACLNTDFGNKVRLFAMHHTMLPISESPLVRIDWPVSQK